MKKTWVKLLAISAWALLASSMQAIEVEVEIEDFSYRPQQVTINVGDTVKWKNRDAVNHTATSGENGVPDGIWNSGLLAMDQIYSFAFETDGTYPYFCTPHPWMTGTVIVNPKLDTGDTTLPAIEETLNSDRAELEIRPTTLEFVVPNAAQIQLAIYNILGQEQVLLAQGIYGEGRYEIPKPQLVAGVYFARLLTDGTAITRKFMQVQ